MAVSSSSSVYLALAATRRPQSARISKTYGKDRIDDMSTGKRQRSKHKTWARYPQVETLRQHSKIFAIFVASYGHGSFCCFPRGFARASFVSVCARPNLIAVLPLASAVPFRSVPLVLEIQQVSYRIDAKRCEMMRNQCERRVASMLVNSSQSE